jgi:uncharacterized membrane protein YqjE
MEESNAGQAGFFSSLKTFLQTLLGVGRTRLALLGTELEEEKIRLAGLLAYGIAALFLLGVACVVLVILLAVAFWESRLLVLGASTLLFFVGGIVCLRLAGNCLQRGSNLFRHSLAELDSDLEALRRGNAQS